MPAPAYLSNPPEPISFAVSFSAFLIPSWVSEGFACLSKAITPAAMGHAADVPLSHEK